MFGWKLSLVALGFIPLMTIGGFLQMHFMYGYSNRDTNVFQRAESVCGFFLVPNIIIKVF